VAAQEGKYLADIFSQYNVATYPGAPTAADGKNIALKDGVWVPLPESAPSFE